VQTFGATESDTMCVELVSGVYTSTYTIYGPNSRLDKIEDYQNATFSQRVTARGDERLTVEFRTDLDIDTQIAYPLDPAAIPEEVRPYLAPTSVEQSDDPAIVELAHKLVRGATTEAQAVVAILEWVRGNIGYDYTFSLAADALSVYDNRSGVCIGFSQLAVALLRAAEIPARVQTGCALWSLPHGGGHGWIEVYYPDLGWVSSEPQSSENYIDRHLVSETWWEWCGDAGVTITRTAQGGTVRPSWRLDTPYGDDHWWMLHSATVVGWDRHPLTAAPDRVTKIVAPGTEPLTLTLHVASERCGDPGWELVPTADWITATPAQGQDVTDVAVRLDLDALPLGAHTADLTLVAPAGQTPGYTGVVSRTVAIQVLVVENPTALFLPLIRR
jgi:transglutaminase-like putative cysteine protease